MINTIHFILIFFIGFTGNINASEKSFFDHCRQLFYELFNEEKPEETDKKIYRIDYIIIQETIEKIIDTALGTDDQPKKTKIDILKNKAQLTRAIIKQLKSAQLKDHYQAMDKAREYTYSALVLHIGERSAELAENEINKIQKPLSMNPHHIKDTIKQEFINKADQAIDQKKDRYCSLCELYGDNLKYKVKAKIRQYLPDEQIYYTPPQPSAPPIDETKPVYSKPKSEEDIYEIYPQGKEEDIRLKLERGQIYRETDCCICAENFIELGRRVTLLCGHSICATCLFSMLYLSNNQQCPLCRQTIELAQFTINYLRKYVDERKLREQFPNQKNTINNYFT